MKAINYCCNRKNVENDIETGKFSQLNNNDIVKNDIGAGKLQNQLNDIVENNIGTGELQNQLNFVDVFNDFSGHYNSGINYGQQDIKVVSYDLNNIDNIKDESLLNKIFDKHDKCNECDYCIVVKRNEKPVSYVFLKKEHAKEMAEEENDEKFGFFLKKHSTGGESVFSITKEGQGYSIAPDNDGLLIGMLLGEDSKYAVQVPDLKFDVFLKTIKEELINNKFEELNNQQIQQNKNKMEIK